MFNVPSASMARNLDILRASAPNSSRTSAEGSRKASRKSSPHPQAGGKPLEVPSTLSRGAPEGDGATPLAQDPTTATAAPKPKKATLATARPPPLQSAVLNPTTTPTKEAEKTATNTSTATTQSSPASTSSKVAKKKSSGAAQPALPARQLVREAADTVVFALPRAKTTHDAIAQLRRIQTRRAASAPSAASPVASASEPRARTQSPSTLASRLATDPAVRSPSKPVADAAAASSTTTAEVAVEKPPREASPQVAAPSVASPDHAAASSAAAGQAKGDLPATLGEFHASPHYVVSLHAARQSVFDDALSGFHSYAAREAEELRNYRQLQVRRKEAQQPVGYDRKMGYEGGISRVIATPIYKDPLEELQANMKDGESLPASALFLMRSHDAQALHNHHHTTNGSKSVSSAALGSVEVDAYEKESGSKADDEKATGDGAVTTAEEAPHQTKAQQEFAELCRAELCFRARLQERLYERQRIPLMFRRLGPPKPSSSPSARAQSKDKKKKKNPPPTVLSASDLASLAVLDPATQPAVLDPATQPTFPWQTRTVARDMQPPSATLSTTSPETPLRPEWPYVYEQFQRDLHREVLLVNGVQCTNPEDAVAAIESFLEYCYDTALAKVQKRTAAAAEKKEALKAKRGFFENLLETVTTFADDVARAAVGLSPDVDPQAAIYTVDTARRGEQLYEATRQVVLAAQQSFMGFPYQLLCEQVGTERIALALEELEEEMDAWMTAEQLARDDEDDISASLQSSLMGSPTWRGPSLSTQMSSTNNKTPQRTQTHGMNGSSPHHTRPSPLPTAGTPATTMAPPISLELPAALRQANHHSRQASAVIAVPTPLMPAASLSDANPRTPIGTPLRLASSFAHASSPRVLSPTITGPLNSVNRLVRLYRSSAPRSGHAKHDADGKAGGEPQDQSGAATDTKADVPSDVKLPSSRSSSSSSFVLPKSPLAAKGEPNEQPTTDAATITTTSPPATIAGEVSLGPETAGNTPSVSVSPSTSTDEKSRAREERRRSRQEKRDQELQRRLKEKREEQVTRMPLIVGEPPVAEFEKLLEKIRQAVRLRNAADRTLKEKREAAKKAHATPAKSDKAAAPAQTATPEKAQQTTSDPRTSSSAVDTTTATSEPASWFREDVDGSALLLPLDPSHAVATPLSESAATPGAHASDRAMRTYLYFNEKRNIPMVCVDKVFRLFVMPGLQVSGPSGEDGAASTSDAQPASWFADKSLLLLIQVQFPLFSSDDVEVRWRWWTV